MEIRILLYGIVLKKFVLIHKHILNDNKAFK
jgi:hypothetical protein